MAKYKVKNLNTTTPTEIRIYSVDNANESTFNPDFTTLDPISGSAGIKLKPFYDINRLDPISHAGLITIDNLFGSSITTDASGTLINYPIENDDSVAQILNNVPGLEVVELQPWVIQ